MVTLSSTLPETFIKDFTASCECGQEIHGKLSVRDVKFEQHDLTSVQLDMTNARGFATYENGITHCPGCGKVLPIQSKKGE
jgi:hypothetical protein